MSSPKITPETAKRYANDPAAFRADLLIDVSGSVRRFGDVMDPWQRNDFAALDPGMMRCNGRSDKPAKLRSFWERGRGSSKTTDLAAIVSWILAFATRPLKGHAFAVDKEQSALIRNAVDTLIRLNPWLGGILEVQKNVVLNIAEGNKGYGSTLEISSSDVGSSYGLLSDFLILDEYTHWEPTADALWHSVISTAAKRSNCLLCVISNAGFVDSWQWKVREAARTSEDWIFSRLDGPVASWFTPERLAEQRKMLPAIAFARLWLNQWSTGGGDALTPEVINAAFVENLQPMTGREPGWSFVAGVDLGLVRDCSSVVVLAVPADGGAGKIRLAHNRLWKPTPGKKVNLLEVEQHILDLDRQFNLENIAFDPWQAEHLGQTLEADAGHRRRNQRRKFYLQPWVRDIPPTPSNLRQQATLTIEFFNDQRFQFYDCEPLRRDLTKLRVEEKANSFRLVSPRDGEGHGDTFSSFGVALLVAHELAGKKPNVLGVINGNSSDPFAAFEKRRREYEAEQARMNQPSKPGDDFKRAIASGNFRVLSQQPGPFREGGRY